jgi:hypothetical protein
MSKAIDNLTEGHEGSRSHPSPCEWVPISGTFREPKSDITAAALQTLRFASKCRMIITPPCSAAFRCFDKSSQQQSRRLHYRRRIFGLLPKTDSRLWLHGSL